MKFFYLALAVVIAASCASTSHMGEEQTHYPNLVTLISPEEQPHQPSKVYIDSVKQITSEGKSVLLISGKFPDACTHLKEVTHRIQNDSLQIKISAWRNPKKMCAQVLTPFSVVYDALTKKELTAHSKLMINDTFYSY